MARAISPQTAKIRELLTNDPDLTAKDALPLLHKAGYETSEATFNVAKSAWKKGGSNPSTNGNGHTKPRRVATVEQNDDVSVEDAVAFIKEQGGLAKAKETLARQQRLIDAFEDLVQLA